MEKFANMQAIWFVSVHHVHCGKKCKLHFKYQLLFFFKDYRTPDRFVYVPAYINKSSHRCLESLQILLLPLISADRHL